VRRRRRAAASRSSSGRGARALKWIGGVTAVISLVLGAQQLTMQVSDSLHRRREAATHVDLARQQALRGAFADAWASVDRAEALQPGDAVDAARVEIAFAWLQDARPGPGRPFSVITDAVTPSLDRALLNARGSRRADLLAHLGWATFLRSRDGVPGDPAARYREALAIDPGNVYANAMLGHWLMWTGSNVESAREPFAAALAAAGDKRLFVRRLQLAALNNRGSAADAEMLRVADDMRQRGEPLESSVADRLFRVFTMRYGSGTGSDDADAGIPPANLEATYDWVVKASPAAARSAEVSAIRERVKP
jgi:hypothetical protein